MRNESERAKSERCSEDAVQTKGERERAREWAAGAAPRLSLVSGSLAETTTVTDRKLARERKRE